MVTVTIRPEQLEGAIRHIGKRSEEAVERSLLMAAQYGRTVMQARTKKQDARASQTYLQNFTVSKVDRGAAISNSARHSIFVERGRRPGRAPPLAPIAEWVKAKGLAKRQLSEARKKRKGTGRRTSRATAKRALRLFTHQIARRVQRKIARRGTKGHYIFQRSMKKIAKKSQQLSRKELRKVFRDPLA